jgi:hypothetical protein
MNGPSVHRSSFIVHRYNLAMAIIMSHPMSTQEMRVLQEFRRIAAETMPVAAIKAIKHPAGGGEAPANSLVAKGFLTADSGGESYTLTEKAKEFLALDVKPEFEEAGSSDAAEE